MATFINCDEKGSECWFRKWQRSFHALRTIIDANSWISSSEEFWFIQMLKYPQYCPSFDAIYWCRHVNSDFPFAALHLWFWIMANILDLDGDCKRHIWFRLNKAVEITAGLHRKVSCKFMQSYVNLCKFMSEPAQLHLLVSTNPTKDKLSIVNWNCDGTDDTAFDLLFANWNFVINSSSRFSR